MNFLESLAAEWYAIQGYFVRTNIKANRRKNGGYDSEIDVLAYLPSESRLVHIETSWDALSWPEREKRYTSKKFVFSKEEYSKIIGYKPLHIHKIAVIGSSIKQPEKTLWGTDIEVITVPSFIAEISQEIKKRHPLKDIIPETYPRLRSFQFALTYDSTSK